MELASFVKDEQFWCNKCDLRSVDSDDSSTGHFYSQFGHTWNPTTRKTNGEYHMIIFALCPDCEVTQ
jgi:hypothetical protein